MSSKCVCCGKFVSENTAWNRKQGKRVAATDAMSEAEDSQGRTIYMVLCNYCKEPFILIDKSIANQSSEQETEQK